MTKKLTTLLSVLLLVTKAAQAGDDPVAMIYEEAGVQGGLVVGLSLADAEFTASLGAPEAITLEALDTDPQQVSKARNHLEAKGLYGKITVEQFDGRSLPYADNLVNLVVASDECQVANEEIARVLVPGGVAWKSILTPET